MASHVESYTRAEYSWVISCDFDDWEGTARASVQAKLVLDEETTN